MPMLRRDQIAVVGGVALIFAGAALFVVSKRPSDDARPLKLLSAQDAEQHSSHLPLRELSPEELTQVLNSTSTAGTKEGAALAVATNVPNLSNTKQTAQPPVPPRPADVVADPYTRMREYRAKLSDEEFVALRKQKQEEYLANVLKLAPANKEPQGEAIAENSATASENNPYAELRARIAEERKQLDEEQLAAERRARFERYVENATRSTGTDTTDRR